MADKVFCRGVSTSDARFRDRATVISSGGDMVARIPVPDSVVLCNGCNQNVAEGSEVGFLIYLDAEDLAEDRAYDFYCGQCVQRLFPEAECVDSMEG